MNGIPETCTMMGKILVVLILLVCITGCGCISEFNSTSPGSNTISETTASPRIVHPTEVMGSPATAEVVHAGEVLRRFTGSRNTTLHYEKTENYGKGDLLTFTGDTGTYMVNNDTGRVMLARMNYPPAPDSLTVSQEDALHIAESYAKEKNPLLWTDSPERSVNLTYQSFEDHGTMGADYWFVWRDVWQDPAADPLSRYQVVGLNAVTVSVDMQGHVTQYSEWYHPESPGVNLTPALTEDEAWVIAQAFYEKHGVTEILPGERTDKGLWVHDDAANDVGWPKYGKRYLAWAFDVEHRSDTTLLGGMIFVDAHDGHIINFDEIL